jgi:hypothetical protein
MNKCPQPPWAVESGILVLRLYKTDGHPNWNRDVNKDHLQPDWPRIVMMDLDADQFKEFDDDPLEFTWKYNLFPEQPIQWISDCAKPPVGEEIPMAADDSRWVVLVNHGKPSGATCCACPVSTIARPKRHRTPAG